MGENMTSHANDGREAQQNTYPEFSYPEPMEKKNEAINSQKSGSKNDGLYEPLNSNDKKSDHLIQTSYN